MRSGATTLQQTLTAEAASVLKHSLGLARRRGHAQVTPLHVAATLLSLRASPLRRACLKSQQQQQQQQPQHPLQCRALELCFNVALNRLPTTPAPNLLHVQNPSLSNALIAALKRAQAHQRRGCIEQQQQQPLLAIKVELEQLIISILDDPSVSRVMREAGFSSTAVKNSVEDLCSSSPSGITPSVFYNSSGGVFSSPCSPSPSENHAHFFPSYTCSSDYAPAVLFSPQKKASPSKEDMKVVMDVLLRNKRRNVVIVGDSSPLTEGLVTELAGKLERGDVPGQLKSIHFVRFQLVPPLRFMKRDEVEMNLSLLKRKVDHAVNDVSGGGGGAIFYVGDLKWTVEASSSSSCGGGYNPVDHLVGEIGRLFCESNNTNSKVWLMGTASYQTYMRCQMKGLENHWDLQAVPVPSGGLALTLHASSVFDSKMSISQNTSQMLETKLLGNNKEEEHEKLNCCEECASNYEKEAQLFKPGQKKLLPSWLQSHSTEAHQKDELAQLKRKWNRLCHCLHQSKQPQSHWINNTSLYGSNNHHSSNAKIYPYNSSYPWWPTNQGIPFQDSSSISFAAADTASKAAHSPNNLVPRFRRQQSCSTIEFNFNDVALKKQEPAATLDSLKGNDEGKEVKITLALGNSAFSTGSSGKTVVGNIADHHHTTLVLRRAHVCKLLQENVPWQSETVASIAEALVDSKQCSASSTTTWLFLQGNDSVGKTRLARAIAESVYGSADSLLHLDMRKLGKAGTLKTNEKTVVLIEGVDFADAKLKKFLADEFEASKFGNSIVILTSGGGNRSNIEEQNKEDSVMRLVLEVTETKRPIDDSSSPPPPCLGHKRRIAELDLFGNKIIKNQRIDEKEEHVFSRKSSFNNLDLNMKVDDDEEEYGHHDGGESSPISSDLTREMGFVSDNLNSNRFPDSIENRFEFNRSADRDREIMEELFLSKIKGSFEEVCGKHKLVKFSVEGRVIEEIGVGCGSFTNSMFEKWLKDIFQSSLLQQQQQKVGNFDDGKEGIVFTLCWGGKGDNRKMDSGDGFMGSCLPKDIQVVTTSLDSLT